MSVVILFVHCEPESQADPTLIMNSTMGHGTNGFNYSQLAGSINELPKEPISAEEQLGLAFMCEEEKLARDVYALMYTKWDISVFSEISTSEQAHMDAIEVLLNKYEIPDPVSSNRVGDFENEFLLTLFDSLVVEGNQNEIEALKVGAAIEEIDLMDLKNQIDQVVDNTDINLVYENLLKGSRNHLRAFVRNLEYRGINYNPMYLSKEHFDEIIRGSMENGF
jgi:hypothetical protein